MFVPKSFKNIRSQLVPETFWENLIICNFDFNFIHHLGKDITCKITLFSSIRSGSAFYDVSVLYISVPFKTTLALVCFLAKITDYLVILGLETKANIEASYTRIAVIKICYTE